MNLTAPLVPNVAAAVPGILGLCDRGWPHRGGHCDPDGRYARLAAILLTVMFASFTLLVHVPMLLAALQPYELERERPESRPDRRRLGRGGLTAASAPRRGPIESVTGAGPAGASSGLPQPLGSPVFPEIALYVPQ